MGRKLYCPGGVDAGKELCRLFGWCERVLDEGLRGVLLRKLSWVNCGLSGKRGVWSV